MKRANFPARKNQRRTDALKRLLAFGTKGKLNAEQVATQADIVRSKITG